MLRVTGLNRKVIAYMALVALGGVAITFAGSISLYMVLLNRPWEFRLVDYIAITLSCACGMILAAGAAASLTRKIVSPVSAIALAARRISDGDLTARAIIDDASLDEVGDMVQDFNQMAQRLERLATETRQWNAAIAHELRTPLTILRGQLQGAADGVYTLDAKLLNSLLGQVETLTQLVQDLRSVGPVDGNELFMELTDVSLDAQMEDLRRLMDGPLSLAGFQTTWRSTPVVVRADVTRLRQAALALLENVRMHATPGPVTVEVVSDGAMGLLRITDGGPGIDADLAEHIFQIFQRGPTAAKGSGLGLAVVRGVAEAHGGHAVWRANPAGGSIFELALPLTSTTSGGNNSGL